jgi:hypothetical protein
MSCSTCETLIDHERETTHLTSITGLCTVCRMMGLGNEHESSLFSKRQNLRFGSAKDLQIAVFCEIRHVVVRFADFDVKARGAESRSYLVVKVSSEFRRKQARGLDCDTEIDTRCLLATIPCCPRDRLQDCMRFELTKCWVTGPAGKRGINQAQLQQLTFCIVQPMEPVLRVPQIPSTTNLNGMSDLFFQPMLESVEKEVKAYKNCQIVLLEIAFDQNRQLRHVHLSNRDMGIAGLTKRQDIHRGCERRREASNAEQAIPTPEAARVFGTLATGIQANAALTAVLLPAVFQFATGFTSRLHPQIFAAVGAVTHVSLQSPDGQGAARSTLYN